MFFVSPGSFRRLIRNKNPPNNYTSFFLTVDKNHVPLLGAMGREDTCKGLDIIQKLLVCNASFFAVQRRVVKDGDLLPTPREDVTIDRIVAGIEFPVLEPSITNVPLGRQGVGRGVMEDFGIRDVPMQLRCIVTPVLLWVLERCLLQMDLRMDFHVELIG